MGSDPAGDKVRLRFAKTGPLRLLSHHDLMRCAERMLRRADVPFKLTNGFHPTPRVVFALSLPLGVEGLNEVVEIELTRPLAAADLLDRLNRQAPDGLTFTSAKVVDLKACAVPRRAVYRLPTDRAADLPVADLLAADKLWVDRIRPKPRRVNVRPYVRGITAHPDAVELDLWVTQNGAARADELVRLLGLGDVLDAGAVLVRTDLEVHDETPAAADAPPDGPPETAPLEHAPVGADDDEANRPATWGLSPSGPVVE
jgi:radical SAM-linked protein